MKEWTATVIKHNDGRALLSTRETHIVVLVVDVTVVGVELWGDLGRELRLRLSSSAASGATDRATAPRTLLRRLGRPRHSDLERTKLSSASPAIVVAMLLRLALFSSEVVRGGAACTGEDGGLGDCRRRASRSR